MRKVSIKELRKTLGRELDNLPFAITRRGVVIAECTLVKSTLQSKCTPAKSTPQPKSTPKNKDKLVKSTLKSVSDTEKCTPDKQDIIKDTKRKIIAMTGKPFLPDPKADRAGKKKTRAGGKR